MKTGFLIFLVSVALAFPASSGYAFMQSGGNMSGYHGLPSEKMAGENSNVVIAKVNGREITMASLVKGMDLMARKHMGPFEKKDIDIDKARKEVLENLIFFELAYDYAKARVSVSQDEINDVLQKLKEKLKTEQEYLNYLKREGYTGESLRQEIKKRLLVEKIMKQEVDGKTKFDENAAKKDYEARKKERYTISERIEFEEIFLPAGDDKYASKEKAESIRKFLVETRDSGNVNRYYPELFVKTFIAYRDKNPEVSKILEGLNSGEVSNLVEDDKGFHMFFVKTRMPGQVIPFERVRKNYEEQARAKRSKQWYEELKGKAKVEIMLDRIDDTHKQSSPK